MNFWRRPREARWRAWVFQVHLWTGLLIGVWALLMGLSGSALVFKEEIDLALEPELFAVEPQSGRTSLDEVLAAIQERFPDYEAGGFIGLARQHQSAYVWIVQVDEKGTAGHPFNVHFNQFSGEILGATERFTGVLGFLEDLHFNLLLGLTGMQINGCFGFALLLMCSSGLVVWWPGAGNWRDGVRVKWGARRKRINYDLHRATGFYAAALLFVMALTGSYFGFPNLYLDTLALATGDSAKEIQAARAFPKSTPVEEGERFSTQAVYERGEALLPPGFVVDGIILPRGKEAVFNVRGSRPGNPLWASYAGSYFDQYSGEPLGTADLREQPLTLRIASLIGPIHFGVWGGVWAKALWVLLGLAPGTLFLTGFSMWWNRVARKRLRRS